MAAVDGIRVGDVLLGTRNLRRWLRGASLEKYLGHAMSNPAYLHPNHRKHLGEIHTPSKNDKFIVAANRDRVFVVWSEKGDIIIPFVNPAEPEGVTPVEIRPGIPGPSERMNGKIFSKWFVKTGLIKPNLQEWPPHARYLWAYWHMSATDTMHLSPDVTRQDGSKVNTGWPHSTVFNMARTIRNNSNKSADYAEMAARAVASRKNLRFPHGLQKVNSSHPGIGPGLEEMLQFEANICQCMEALRSHAQTPEGKVQMGADQLPELLTTPPEPSSSPKVKKKPIKTQKVTDHWSVIEGN